MDELRIYDPDFANAVGDSPTPDKPGKEKFSKRVIEKIKKYISKLIAFIKKCIQKITTMINKILHRFFKVKTYDVSRNVYNEIMSLIKEIQKTKFTLKIILKTGKAALNGTVVELREACEDVSKKLTELMDIKENFTKSPPVPDDNDIITIRSSSLDEVQQECEYCRDMAETFKLTLLMVQRKMNIKMEDISDDNMIRINNLCTLASVAARFNLIKSMLITNLIDMIKKEAERVNDLKNDQKANESFISDMSYSMESALSFYDDYQIAEESNLRNMNVKTSRELLSTPDRIRSMPEETKEQVIDKIDVIDRHLKCIDDSLKFFLNAAPDNKDKVISIILKVIVTAVQIKGMAGWLFKTYPRMVFAISKGQVPRIVKLMAINVIKSIGFNYVKLYANSYNTKTMEQVRDDIVLALNDNKKEFEMRRNMLKRKMYSFR